MKMRCDWCEYNLSNSEELICTFGDGCINNYSTKKSNKRKKENYEALEYGFEEKESEIDF